MPYPVTASVQGVAVGQSWETTFRPEKAGLVNAVVVASGFPASPPPPAPAPQPLIAPGGGPSVGGTAGFHEPPPLDFTVALRLDLVKPGTAEPVASTEGSVHIGPGSAAKNQL